MTTINRKTLFAEMKGVVGPWTAEKIAGVDALLDACDAEGVTDNRHIAYILATPMIETGGSYEPITENLNYAEAALNSKFGHRITPAQAALYGRNDKHPADQEAIGNIIYGGIWGKTNLGNTQDGDGYRYRGRGLVQTTGRGLYTKFGFADNPDVVTDVKASASIMVKGMRDGTFTGKKFSDFFGDANDWVGARRIVNGTDRANDIARYAQKIVKALNKAEVANPYPLSTSRTVQGSVVAGGGGAIQLVDSVNAVNDAVQAHTDAFTTGNVVGIIIGLVAVSGALYALYARWDDAGRPKFWQ